MIRRINPEEELFQLYKSVIGSIRTESRRNEAVIEIDRLWGKLDLDSRFRFLSCIDFISKNTSDEGVILKAIKNLGENPDLVSLHSQKIERGVVEANFHGMRPSGRLNPNAKRPDHDLGKLISSQIDLIGKFSGNGSQAGLNFFLERQAEAINLHGIGAGMSFTQAVTQKQLLNAVEKYLNRLPSDTYDSFIKHLGSLVSLTNEPLTAKLVSGLVEKYNPQIWENMLKKAEVYAKGCLRNDSSFGRDKRQVIPLLTNTVLQTFNSPETYKLLEATFRFFGRISDDDLFARGVENIVNENDRISPFTNLDDYEVYGVQDSFMSYVNSVLEQAATASRRAEHYRAGEYLAKVLSGYIHLSSSSLDNSFKESSCDSTRMCNLMLHNDISVGMANLICESSFYGLECAEIASRVCLGHTSLFFSNPNYYEPSSGRSSLRILQDIIYEKPNGPGRDEVAGILLKAERITEEAISLWKNEGRSLNFEHAFYEQFPAAHRNSIPIVPYPFHDYDCGKWIR